MSDQSFAGISPLGDVFRLPVLASLAELSVKVGDERRAESILGLLRAWEGHNVQLSLAEDRGPVTYFIGMLERALGRSDDAIIHLETSLAQVADAHLHRLACEVRIEFAAALVDAGAPDRAAALVAEARTFAQSRGLDDLARRCERVG